MGRFVPLPLIALSLTTALAAPETWFHVIGGNASKEGLTADLKAIQEAGFEGIQFFHGGTERTEPWPGLEHRQIPCLSAEWDDLVAHAARECERFGLTFRMQGCPGWSMAGGPWITDETAQRRLVGSTTFVTSSGKTQTVPLADPEMPHPKARDYHDIAVLAFPTLAGDRDGLVVPTSSPTLPQIVDSADGALSDPLEFAFADPVVVRTLELPSVALMAQQALVCEPDTHLVVEAEDAEGVWQLVASRDLPRGNWEEYLPQEGVQSVALAPIRTRRLRLRFMGSHPIHIPFARFRCGARMDNWEAHSGRSLRELLNGASAPASAPIAPEAIRDVTDLCAGGTFCGSLPVGEWTLLRVGHVNSGFENGPAPSCATGWECDKLDPRGIEANFDAYVGRLLKGPLAGGRLKGILLDSWEAWRPDWTWRMEAYFQELKGYALRLKLPALFGYVIGDVKSTKGFLYDWRDVVSTLIERNFFRRMVELAHERGIECQYETAFGDVLPGDILRYWKWCDTPMCEFWHPHRNDGYVGSWQNKPVRPCVSAAHLYGKRRVAAESFTSFELSWNESPRRFKRTADIHLARGVTHLVFHTYTHNPYPTGRAPGTSFGGGIGSPFLRTQTWWKHMGEFTGYLTRCEALLEAGRSGNDFLWFLGDGLDVRPDGEANPTFEGFAFDLLNHDALVNCLKAVGTEVAVADGTRWGLVYVPSDVVVSSASEARFEELEKAGVPVVRGGRDSLAAALRGRMMAVKGDVLWLRRRLSRGESYFICPRTDDNPFWGTVRFAATGAVRVYDPVVNVWWTPVACRVNEATDVELTLPPNGSLFVTFGDVPLPSGARERQAPSSRVSQAPSLALSSWSLSFPPGHGIRRQPWALSALGPLAELPNVPEEVRGFSGTCVYQTEFDLALPEDLDLELGDVETVAEILVNGQLVATRWTPPYACRIPSSLLKPGKNALEVRVTTTWLNALVYEARGNGKSLGRWVISGPNAGHPYLPSGLLGPVRITRTGSGRP